MTPKNFGCSCTATTHCVCACICDAKELLKKANGNSWDMWNHCTCGGCVRNYVLGPDTGFTAGSDTLSLIVEGKEIYRTTHEEFGRMVDAVAAIIKATVKGGA